MTRAYTAEASLGGGTVDAADVARFDAIAQEWWDRQGKFKLLHRMNPVRIGYVRDRVCDHLQRDPMGVKPFDGLAIADIGCGGGLLSESMSRLGGRVTGLDASAEAIAVARLHSAQAGLTIDYRCTTVEDLARSGARFDVVLALEIIEHVADRQAFVGCLADILNPGGAIVLSTLNRTPKSLGLAIVAAEYVLRWVPAGTHDWRNFSRPSALGGALRRHGIDVRDATGIVYDPVRREWALSPRDLSVNYLMFGTKGE